MPTVGGSIVRRITDRSLTAQQNVERDDQLLREGNTCVRVAQLSDTSVSLGVGQSDHVGSAVRARSEGLSVVRRTTGGSALLHLPGDIVWSVVIPRSHSLVGRDFTRAYRRLGAGVVDMLERHTIGAQWRCPLSTFEDYCLLSSRGEVLTVGERALGGAAQHLTRETLLHHGFLASRLDRRLLGRLFGLAPASMDSNLTDLKSLGAEGSAPAMAQELLGALARRVEGRELVDR